jgi:hypothetical protein
VVCDRKKKKKKMKTLVIKRGSSNVGKGQSRFKSVFGIAVAVMVVV